MSVNQRNGLTLVEMLVLVAILGMLLLLIGPCLMNPRVPERRNACMNNLKQLGLATLNYESKHHEFPGYVNRIATTPGGQTATGSWLISLLPFMERDDLAKKWAAGNRLGPNDCPQWICPGDTARPNPSQLPIVSYVANCGLPGDDDTPADGVFHNHDVDKKRVRVGIDFLSNKDGSTNTLLLSENLQAGFATDTEEANVGMVWFHKPDPASHPDLAKDVGPRPQDLRYARPSSLHPGVFVAVFCDGHVSTLNTSIDYRVYQHLMTPDSQAAGVPGKLDPNAF